MSKDRFSRPDLPRTAAYHDMMNLLNAAGSRRHPDAPPGDPPEATPDPGPDFVTSGVSAAYQVIDTYLRQGRNVARRLGKLSYAPLRMGRRVPEFQARWLQLSNDLMADWFDLIGLYSEALLSLGDADPTPDAATAPGTSTGAPRTPAGPPLTVDYQVVSPRPALLHHEFLDDRATPELASHGLRSLDSALIPIDVTFAASPEQHRVVIGVRVAADQPPGTYTGALLDASTGEAVGTLSLRLD